jgi:hypothetical protein
VRPEESLEEWLLYFTDGLAQVFESVAERARDLNSLTQRLERTIELNTIKKRQSRRSLRVGVPRSLALTTRSLQAAVVPKPRRIYRASSRAASSNV